MKYLIYLRVSTDKQEVATQKRLCLDYLEKQSTSQQYKIYDDGDLSTQVKMAKRPILQEMLKDIRPGDIVLVYKLDRLSRDIIEMVTIHRLITIQNKAKVISLNDPYSDEFSVGLMGLIAQKERDDTRTKTKDKLRTKKECGERVGTLPYGFTLDYENLIHVNGPDGKKILKPGLLLPLPHEQAVLAVMCRLFDEGKSFREIANILTDLGHMNRKGNPFQHMSIYRILGQTGRAKSFGPPQEETKFELFHSKAQ